MSDHISYGCIMFCTCPLCVCVCVCVCVCASQVARLLVSDDPSCVQLANDSQHQVPGGYTLTLSYEGLFSGAYLTGSGSRSGTDTHTDTSQYRNQSDTEQLQMQAQR